MEGSVLVEASRGHSYRTHSQHYCHCLYSITGYSDSPRGYPKAKQKPFRERSSRSRHSRWDPQKRPRRSSLWDPEPAAKTEVFFQRVFHFLEGDHQGRLLVLRQCHRTVEDTLVFCEEDTLCSVSSCIESPASGSSTNTQGKAFV